MCSSHLETAAQPLLLAGVEDDGLVALVAVLPQLVGQDALHGLAVIGHSHLLDGICHRHVLREGGRTVGVGIIGMCLGTRAIRELRFG